MTTRTWEAAAAALMGRDHLLLQRNRQDHALAVVRSRVAVAVVSDGCGEGEGSEVGARISALVAERAAVGHLLSGAPLRDAATVLAAAVLTALAAVAEAAAGTDASARARFAAEHLAATLWVALLRGAEGTVFGWGDGRLRLGDRIVAIDQDAPSYLVRSLGRSIPAPTHVETLDPDAAVALATDGFDEASLAALPARASAPALLRFMRLQQRGGAFADDAAVAALWPSALALDVGGPS
jgi:hypothetical protein